MELLTKLNAAHHITIAMVTHEPDMAVYARRQVKFRDGLIVADDVRVERLGMGDIEDRASAVSPISPAFNAYALRESGGGEV